MKKTGKKNKGFSLIELIVVVLIIGVIGIALAPQVMKWVDTSKTNTDINNAESLQSSVQAALADWQNDGGKLSTMTKGAKYTISSAGILTATTADTDNDAALWIIGGDDDKSLKNYIDTVTGEDYPKSKYDAKGYIIEVTTAGKVTVKCNAQNPTATPALVP